MFDSTDAINYLQSILRCDLCIYKGQSDRYCNCKIKNIIELIKTMEEDKESMQKEINMLNLINRNNLKMMRE